VEKSSALVVAHSLGLAQVARKKTLVRVAQKTLLQVAAHNWAV
jgi:hypothetical protein